MDLFYWFKRNTGTVLWFSQTEIQTRCYVVIKLKTEKLTLFFQGGLESQKVSAYTHSMIPWCSG